MSFNRKYIAFIIICVLIIGTLSGCKTGINTSSSINQKQETYFIEVTDYSAFHTESLVVEELKKTLMNDNLSEEKNLQSAVWPMRLRLTNPPLGHSKHNRLGSPTSVSSNPITCLLSTLSVVCWATAGVINTGTPDAIIKMSLNIPDSNGTIWRIKDEISLYTLNKEKSQIYIAKKASIKIAKYIQMLRAGKPVENAVKETNAYALEQLRRKDN